MKRYLLINIIAFVFASIYFVQARAQSTTVTVVDQNGKPVAGATVWYNEGSAFLKTDNDGRAQLDMGRAGSKLRIEANGYDTRLIVPDSIISNKIALATYQSGQNNLINIPFGQLEKRRIVGAVDALHPDELLKYDLNQNVLGAINGRVAGVYDSRNIRGLGNAIVVIDGIPRSTDSGSGQLNLADNLNLLEIKEITVLKDATAAMLYGAKAGQGVILITTKRGTPFKRQLKVYTEAGVNDPVSYPNYLPAADYMTLYNEALVNDGLAPKYSVTDIQNTRNHIDPIRYPDESFYNATYLKKFTQFYKGVTEASGGSDIVHYFASLGLNLNGSLYQPQGSKSSSSDRINFRGNVDYKINKWLSASLDAVAVYDASRYPNGYFNDSYSGDFFQFASTQLPNSFPTLIPISQVMIRLLLIRQGWLTGNTC